MLTLFETAVAFATIMLILSLLVKAIVSLIKSNMDLYPPLLRRSYHNVLVDLGLSVKDIAAANDQRMSPLNIEWNSLEVDKLFDVELFKWHIQKLDKSNNVDLSDVNICNSLAQRLYLEKRAVHSRLEKRLKSLSFTVGVSFCLLTNTDAVAIWSNLYEDGKLRTAWASGVAPILVDSVPSPGQTTSSTSPKGNANITTMSVDGGKAPNSDARSTINSIPDVADEHDGGATPEESGFGPRDTSKPTNQKVASGNISRSERANQTNDVVFEWLRERLDGESAWIGAVYRPREAYSNNQPESAEQEFWSGLKSFLSSFLTGILISVGAPYWHDLLRTLSSIRGRKTIS